MTPMNASPTDDLQRAFASVEAIMRRVRPEQWAGPTPCTDWSTRQLVTHVVGMNRVFTAMLTGAPLPQRETIPDHELVDAYMDSATQLVEAFSAPGVLEQEFTSPLGTATGTERINIRLYDLLAHGWDLAAATGQPRSLPEDLCLQALSFAQQQLDPAYRPGRFAPAMPCRVGASAVEQLVAFLGRDPAWALPG